MHCNGDLDDLSLCMNGDKRPRSIPALLKPTRRLDDLFSRLRLGSVDCLFCFVFSLHWLVAICQPMPLLHAFCPTSTMVFGGNWNAGCKDTRDCRHCAAPLFFLRLQELSYPACPSQIFGTGPASPSYQTSALGWQQERASHTPPFTFLLHPFVRCCCRALP